MALKTRPPKGYQDKEVILKPTSCMRDTEQNGRKKETWKIKIMAFSKAHCQEHKPTHTSSIHPKDVLQKILRTHLARVSTHGLLPHRNRSKWFHTAAQLRRALRLVVTELCPRHQSFSESLPWMRATRSYTQIRFSQ